MAASDSRMKILIQTMVAAVDGGWEMFQKLEEDTVYIAKHPDGMKIAQAYVGGARELAGVFEVAAQRLRGLAERVEGRLWSKGIRA